ncbi:MAG: hypothetical protein CL512_05850 [Actinobacteria bacterium]|nr:hypothetical protein [Actinomycetota bacterium]|tara:strand:+ start:779 stop:1240 length:462 start_codon:yes stop_codon:yes gene_type:complete
MKKNSVKVKLITRYKKSELDKMQDSDFLLPEERKFPIITAKDVEVALYEFQTIEYRMRREVFLDKLTRKVRSLGPKFVKSLSKTIKDTLKIKSMRLSKNPQDYAYQNKEEALEQAEELGLSGYHECTSVKKGTVYVPGSSRMEFLNWFKEAVS